MKTRTPLSNLAGGAQQYLRLETKALRLKVFLTAADTAFSSLQIAATGIVLAIALALFGVSLALWLTAIMEPAAAFAVTGALFVLLAVIAWRLLRSKQETVKDRLVAGISGEPSRYGELRAQLAQLNAESARLAGELETQLRDIGETAARIERLFARDENGSSGSMGNLARSAAGALIRHALLPKAGVAARVVAPLIAGALVRSAPLAKLLQKVRTAFGNK